MKRMDRSWGCWGLVLLLVGSLMIPTVSQALPRGGDILLGGYEDSESPGMEIIGDPDDGSSGRPQQADVSIVQTGRLVLRYILAQRLNLRDPEALPGLRLLSIRSILRFDR